MILEEDGPMSPAPTLHPYWFQALGCVVGFDWHSPSVVTTNSLRALNEALSKRVQASGRVFFVVEEKGVPPSNPFRNYESR